MKEGLVSLNKAWPDIVNIQTQRPVRFHQFPDPVKEKESATSTDIRTQRPVRFHQFPDPVKEKERCSKWIINLRRADLHLKNIRHKSVCSVHFELNAYNCPSDIATSRLLPSAVPTLIACPNPPRLSASCRPPPKKRCVDTSESINLEAETHCADSDPTEDESTSNGTKTESGEDKLLKLEKELAKAKLALKHYQSRNKLLCRQVKCLRAANEKCVTKELALHSKLEKAIKFNLENFLKQLPPLPSALISVLLKKAKKVSWKKEPQGVGLCPSLLKMIHLSVRDDVSVTGLSGGTDTPNTPLPEPGPSGGTDTPNTSLPEPGPSGDTDTPNTPLPEPEMTTTYSEPKRLTRKRKRQPEMWKKKQDKGPYCSRQKSYQLDGTSYS
ncbi:hypothetical protein EGW08_007146 [Elysia chlorotica]|uniref:THAP-type domain-containing protein n=1 Tax=Elysia chlorotica TaxID=188477 RepID=A0A433TU61_ELYCH|nr:hypothetical protein EGW08_007146 [Elysia chlorotica]